MYVTISVKQKSDTSVYAFNLAITSQLTIVALGLLAEPREERLAGEGSAMSGNRKGDGDSDLTSHAALWRC